MDRKEAQAFVAQLDSGAEPADASLAIEVGNVILHSSKEIQRLDDGNYSVWHGISDYTCTFTREELLDALDDACPASSLWSGQPLTDTCKYCGMAIVGGEHSTWVDETDGDGCGESVEEAGVHRPSWWEDETD